MEFKERFQHILNQLNMSPAEFSERINIQRSNLSHILSGRNKPSLGMLQKMLEAFPELNPAYIINGLGEPLINQTSESTPKLPESPGLDLRFPPKSKEEEKETPAEPSLDQKPETLEQNTKSKVYKSNNRTLKQVLLLYTDGSVESYSVK